MEPGTSTALNDLMKCVENDTFEGVSFVITPVVEALLVSARMHFRTDANNTRTALKLSTTDSSQLSITDNTTASWTISMPEQQLSLKAGTYVWQLETTDADDRVITYVSGTFTVLTDLTR